MARTSLTSSKLNREGSRSLRTKLAEHDTALDALEAVSALGGGDFKQSVRAASTANLALNGTQTIDGVACIVGDRVLAKDQTTQADKGIYLVASGAWTRATDFDTSAEVTGGVVVFVNEGAVNGNRIFDLTTDDPITLGVTSLTFTVRPNLVELASTATGKGAALIGIEDSAAKITATTVETALAEIAADNWVTAVRITDAILTGAKAAVVADNAVVGGVEVCFVVAVPDGATADVDVTLTHKTEITWIEVTKTGGAGGASDTLQVKNVANAITDVMSINVADKIIVRPSTIDDAFTVIAAGTVLRFSRTKASAANVSCRVVVRGVRRT